MVFADGLRVRSESLSKSVSPDCSPYSRLLQALSSANVIGPVM